MKAYKLSTHDIRRMTPWAQLSLYDEEATEETLYFDTEQEYLEWATTRR